MAHLNVGDKHSGKMVGDSPLAEGGSSHAAGWSSSPRESHGHEHGDDHHKKSMMAKVRGTAKKWKHTLAKMTHGSSHRHHQHKQEAPLPTHEQVTSAETQEENAEYRGAPIYESEKAPDSCAAEEKGTERRNHESEDKNPEYHGAPIYESEKAPDACAIEEKVTERRNHESEDKSAEYRGAPIYESEKAAHVYSEEKPRDQEILDSHGTIDTKEVEHDKGMPVNECANKPLHPGGEDKALSQVITAAAGTGNGLDGGQMTMENGTIETNEVGYDKGAPQNECVIQSLQHGEEDKALSEVITPAASTNNGFNGGEVRMETIDTKDIEYDKGVSVKEYVMQTLEPGEGDKALSEVITAAASTNGGFDGGGEMSMAEKVKEVVISFLGVHDASNQISTTDMNHNEDEFQGKRMQTN